MHEWSTCGPPKAVEEGRRPDLVVLGVELPRLVVGEVEVGVTQPSALFGTLLPLRLLNNGEPTTVERAAIKGITLTYSAANKRRAEDLSIPQSLRNGSFHDYLLAQVAMRPTNLLSAAQKGTAPEEKYRFLCPITFCPTQVHAIYDLTCKYCSPVV